MRRGADAAPGAGITRRTLLLASTFSAGAWTLGPAAAQTQTAPPPQPATSAGFPIWLRFHAQGLTVLTITSEIGQGTQSVIAQVAAEEIGLPLERIDVQLAPIEPAFVSALGGFLTVGSAGFRLAWGVLGKQCAAAREMLLQAAAQRWSVAADVCDIRDGVVRNRLDPRTATLAELLDAAAALQPPADPPRRPRALWQVLGRSVPRRDIPAKTDGSFAFGIDAAPPGRLLYAAVLHAPQFGGRLLDVDAAPALRLKGVRKVVKLDAAVAVVATSWWTAHKATRALAPRWADGPFGTWSSAEHAAALREAVQAGQGEVFAKRANSHLDPEAATRALSTAARVIEHAAEFPFLAHAPMEPLNATVRVSDGGGSAELWLSTQAQDTTRTAVARVLGIEAARVRLNSLPAGGGFGRRVEHDFATEAALIAKAVGPGIAVKTIWSREVDLRAGFYRPASAARMQLALDAEAMPTALRVDIASSRLEDHSSLSSPPVAGMPDSTATMGWVGQSYALPPMRIGFTKIDRGVPVAYWRAVAATQNTFALETLIDLAARAAGSDPLQYRRRLLTSGDGTKNLSNRRALALLEALATQSHWAADLTPGRHRGVAINEANRAVAGHAVEIELLAPRRFRIVRIVAAIDAGWIGNPDAVRAQLMGGTIFGLASALEQAISFDRGSVVQGNFDSYPVLKSADIPPIELIVLENGERPAGVGEEAVPTVAPALANALLAAGGEPVTRLPLSQAGWQWVASTA